MITLTVYFSVLVYVLATLIIWWCLYADGCVRDRRFEKTTLENVWLCVREDFSMHQSWNLELRLQSRIANIKKFVGGNHGTWTGRNTKRQITYCEIRDKNLWGEIAEEAFMPSWRFWLTKYATIPFLPIILVVSLIVIIVLALLGDILGPVIDR